MRPVQLHCWHFMAYPFLSPDFDEKYDTGWVTVPNSLWDREKTKGLYQEYIDQLVYGEELGFDGRYRGLGWGSCASDWARCWPSNRRGPGSPMYLEFLRILRSTLLPQWASRHCSVQRQHWG